jgi:hypothetical protein
MAANVQAMCTSFKQDLLNGLHAFGTSVVRASTTPDTFKGDPLFANTTDLLANHTGVPDCSAYVSVPACMGWNYLTQTAASLSVIGDLTPSASGTSGRGYQGPSGTCTADADYPTWTKGVIYLQYSRSIITENPGLITKPCGL